MKALFLYSSREGQTQKITHYIIENLVKSNSIQQYDVMPLTADLDIAILDYQIIIIGASIHYGHYSKSLKQFVTKYAKELNQRKTAFFGVNLIARKPDKQTPETNSYTRKFLAWSPWEPTVSAVFAGALYYPRYRYLDRVIIHLIMKLTGGETDTSKEVEYTDWQKVSNFIELLKISVFCSFDKSKNA